MKKKVKRALNFAWNWKNVYAIFLCTTLHQTSTLTNVRPVKYSFKFTLFNLYINILIEELFTALSFQQFTHLFANENFNRLGKGRKVCKVSVEFFPRSDASIYRYFNARE